MVITTHMMMVMAIKAAQINNVATVSKADTILIIKMINITIMATMLAELAEGARVETDIMMNRK